MSTFVDKIRAKLLLICRKMKVIEYGRNSILIEYFYLGLIGFGLYGGRGLMKTLLWSLGFVGLVASIIWSFNQMPEVHVAMTDDYFAAFEQESQRIVNHTDGVVELMWNHNGAHMDVDLYVNNDFWEGLSEAEQLTLAKSIGDGLHGSIEEPMTVDFRLETGRNVVVEGSLHGDYTVIK